MKKMWFSMLLMIVILRIPVFAAEIPIVEYAKFNGGMLFIDDCSRLYFAQSIDSNKKQLIAKDVKKIKDYENYYIKNDGSYVVFNNENFEPVRTYNLNIRELCNEAVSGRELTYIDYENNLTYVVLDNYSNQVERKEIILENVQTYDKNYALTYDGDFYACEKTYDNGVYLVSSAFITKSKMSPASIGGGFHLLFSVVDCTTTETLNDVALPLIEKQMLKNLAIRVNIVKPV